MKKRNPFLLVSILLLSLSLVGCGTNKVSDNKTSKEEAKTVEVRNADKDQNEMNAEKTELPTASGTDKTHETEKKPEQKSSQETIQTPTTKKQPVQQNNSTSVASTTTNDAATTKPAATTTTTTAATTTTSTETTTTKAPEPKTTVTLSIVGPKERGTILGVTKVSFKDGDTIFDILNKIKKEKGIVIDSTGSGATAYIEGIDNIYEFDYGAKSGWVFKQNGASLTKSVGVTKVKDGDRVECYYTE